MMRLKKKFFLFIPLLFLTQSVAPILGLENIYQNIPSYGSVNYPESFEQQLGVFDVKRGPTLPAETSWIWANSPDYGKINMLENPDFEISFTGWSLQTFSGEEPIELELLPGYEGNSAVMISNELGYRGGGLYQEFYDVPPNTNFHFSAFIKTVDIDSLEARVLYYDIVDSEGNWYGGQAGRIQGSTDWTLYEESFTTPNRETTITLYPSLPYNQGEFWIDNVSLIQEGWQSPEVPIILNWIKVYPYPWGTQIETASELQRLENELKSIPAENFWGILFIREEIYRTYIGFNDDVNTTWFNEKLLGYPLYIEEQTGATIAEWKDEMYLRMIRGFYTYFSPLTKVGITWGQTEREYWEIAYGEPATTFIKENYDFLILYPYTKNLDEWISSSEPYLNIVEKEFPKQKKFWLLTFMRTNWEPEAMGLELKNCFDRNIPVMRYYEEEPPFEQIWLLMLEAIELYKTGAPYYEASVYGRNLLTDFIGYTYGWVEVLG
jgi:hypothetical protein